MSKNSNVKHVYILLQTEKLNSTAKYLAGNIFLSTFGSCVYLAKLVYWMAFVTLDVEWHCKTE
jgi:hypothetical protein